MAGRRLVDVAKLFNASKSVAQKHIALRSHQLDVYSQTSSLAKAVKHQTDRVTLTAAAAIALSRRFNEEAPAYAKAAADRATGAQSAGVPRGEAQSTDIPRKETTQQTAHVDSAHVEQGLEQDHHYARSAQNTAAAPPPQGELHVEQDEAQRRPLPDGTIPSGGLTLDQGEKGQDTFSKRSVSEAPKEPLGNDGLQPVESTKSTIPVPEAAEEEVPEGINTDIFHSRRVAMMLGRDRYSRKDHLGTNGGAGNPYIPKGNPYIPSKNPYIPSANPHVPSKNPYIPDTQPSDQVKPKFAEKEMQDLAAELAKDAEVQAAAASEVNPESEKPAYALRESRVPSSRFGRLWQYAGLGTSMAMGAVGEGLRRVTGSAAATTGSLMLSSGNLEVLVAKLSRMRGAALKLGQMISFQDSKMLPPAIQEVLQRVQDSADYMPASQRNEVLTKNLGPEWRDLFTSFEDVPIAAASIGQVHKAVLRSTGQPVAVKVQYPGVANSIDSDLSNLSILLTASRILPKGLFLDKTIANARTELGWECDYNREAECQMRFHGLIADDTDAFTVPKVFTEASGPTVLTAELMSGVGVAKLKNLTQDERDWIGTQVLRLCLREIVEFQFMQTDPNWTNFLYNASQRKIELLDFGACRAYPDEFIAPYVKVLIAASHGDRNAIRELSLELGYLTGSESQAMLDAHTQSVLTLAEPFKRDGPALYDFRDQTITDRVRDLIPLMVKERLAPPPEETYSLHRKLSGAFLLCAKLGSKVPCRELFSSAVEKWEAKQ